MAKTKTRLGIVAVGLTLLATLVVIAPAFGASGDYGVATGSSTTCGGTSGPACTMNWIGYGLTFSHIESDGDLVYTFDDFNCTVSGAGNGIWYMSGSECSQFQPDASDL